MKETEDWDKNKKLSEEIPEIHLVRTMLKAFETNKRKMAKFSESMDPCIIGRNTAVLQYTQFSYANESTRRRMSNAGTPKPGRLEEEWAKLDLAPIAVRDKAVSHC